MNSMTEYSKQEYLTTKDAEGIFGLPSCDIGTLLRAVKVNRVAVLKRPGYRGRPANLYRRADICAVMNYINDFKL